MVTSQNWNFWISLQLVCIRFTLSQILINDESKQNLIWLLKIKSHVRRRQYSGPCTRSNCGGSYRSCPNSKVERCRHQLRSMHPFTLKRYIVSPRNATSFIPPYAFRQAKRFSFNTVCSSVRQQRVMQSRSRMNLLPNWQLPLYPPIKIWSVLSRSCQYQYTTCAKM